MTDQTKAGLEVVAWMFRSPLNTVSKLQWRKPCMAVPEEHGWCSLVRQSDAAAIIAKLTTERESFYKVAMERNEQFVQTCTEVERLSNLNQTMAVATVGLRQEVESPAADRDEWIACHAKVFRELQETKALVADKRAELAAANERIAALEQDAARYQWLRYRPWQACHTLFPSAPWRHESHEASQKRMDAAIDAASEKGAA